MMIITDTQYIGGQIVGLGFQHRDGSEDFNWIEPVHNRVTSVGIDHLLQAGGAENPEYTATERTSGAPGLWFGPGCDGIREGALTYMQLGTGTSQPSFGDTHLAKPLGSLCGTYRTGTPFTGTKVTDDGCYIRVTYVSAAMVAETKVTEVGIFGKIGSNPVLFARIVLEKPVTVLADDSLMVTYELRIARTGLEASYEDNFFDIMPSDGEGTLHYGTKAYTGVVRGAASKPYTDLYTKDPCILSDSDGVREFPGTLATLSEKNELKYMYFMRLPAYYHHDYTAAGVYDSLGYSTDEQQDFGVSDDRLSKASSEIGDYSFEFMPYEGVGSLDKHRDIKITMGAYNPAMVYSNDYTDITFIRIRGTDYKFGYLDGSDWVQQYLRKWGGQAMSFTYRTRYVTGDTMQMDGTIPE